MTDTPLTDDDIARLQDLLDAVPAPLEPLDAMALDGFLCGVILQPQPVPPSRWLPFATDVEGRALPPAFAAAAAAAELSALLQRRHAELAQAIGGRQWFDPWVFEIDDDDGDDDGAAGSAADATPSAAVLPWVAGFAAAMDVFPALMRMDDPALVEPLALLYRHFDPDDLEDADALLAVIDTLEPADDLAEAVEDLVRSLMLIADVTRPRRPATAARPVRAAKKAAGRRPR